MNFTPVLPFSGYAGWSFLNRTREAQQQTFENTTQFKRDSEYFASKIGSVKTADALVGDRRLLSVALGAFGLDADIGSKYFVTKILTDGSLDDSDLANRMSDKRYLAFTKAFGFGDFSTPRTVLSDFPDEILSAYADQQFEAAVGEQDTNMRLALGLERDLGTVIDKATTKNGAWYGVMGNTPLRTVFENALGLPSSFGTLDLDLQLDGFRRAAERRFGVTEVADFADPEMQEKLIRLFLLRSEISANSAQSQSGNIALSLLQANPVRWQK